MTLAVGASEPERGQGKPELASISQQEGDQEETREPE